LKALYEQKSDWKLENHAHAGNRLLAIGEDGQRQEAVKGGQKLGAVKGLRGLHFAQNNDAVDITGWFQAEEDLGIDREEFVKTLGIAGESKTSRPVSAIDGEAGKLGASGKTPASEEPVTDLYISQSASMRHGIALSDLTKISFTLSHMADANDDIKGNENQAKKTHRNWPSSRCVSLRLTDAECDNSTRSTQSVQSFSFELLASRDTFLGTTEDVLLSITFERRHGNLANPCYITLAQKAADDFTQMVAI
jgi:hypothetical protein